MRPWSPEEHIRGHHARDKDQEPRPEGPGLDPRPPQQCGREVLERQDVATPATKEAPEDERAEQRHGEEHDPRVEIAVLQGVHRLRGLDRRQGPARDGVVGNVRGDQEVDREQHADTPAGPGRLADLRDRDATEDRQGREIDVDPDRAATNDLDRPSGGGLRSHCQGRPPQNASPLTISPELIVLTAFQSVPGIESFTNRTEPSPKSELIPPGCRLLDPT